MTTYADFVKSRFKTPWATLIDMRNVDPQVAASHHAILGLVGEWFEYKYATDNTNRREELGDMLFYMEALAQALDVELPIVCRIPRVSEREYAGVVACMEQNLGELLDMSKKQLIYGKSVCLIARAMYVSNCFGPILGYHCYELEGLQSENVDKLTKRYPTTYTNEAANARADKMEV